MERLNRQDFQKRIQQQHQEVYKQTENNELTVQYLLNWGIYNQIQCEYDECINFQGPTIIIADKNTSDGYRYYCQSCKSTYSIRSNIPFFQIKTSASTLIRIIEKETFSGNNYQKISKEYGISRHTATKVINYSKNAISYDEKRIRESTVLGLQPFEDLDERELEYQSSAVEVDECLLTHIDGQQCWVVGIYDRATQETVLVVVGNDRSSVTMNAIFQQYVATDSIQKTRVYCDMWRGYNGLNDLDYETIRVNHSIEFGQGHRTTNHIEARWRVLREECRFSNGFRVNSVEEAQKEVDFGWASAKMKKQEITPKQILQRSIKNYFEDGFTLQNFQDQLETSDSEGDMEIE